MPTPYEIIQRSIQTRQSQPITNIITSTIPIRNEYTLRYSPIKTTTVNIKGTKKSVATEPFDAPYELMKKHEKHLTKPFTIDILRNGTLISSYPKSKSYHQFTLDTEIDADVSLSEKLWFYKNVRMEFNNSDYVAMERELPFIMEGDEVRINFFDPIQPNNKPQKLRDGDAHCILTPIIDHFTNLVKNAKSDKTKSNMERCLKLSNEYLKQYADGVPMEHLPEVAKKLDIRIILQDSTLNPIQVYNPFPHGATFKYINSRINHGQHYESRGILQMDRKPETIPTENGVKLLNECIEKQEWHLYKGTLTHPTHIQTVQGKYITSDTEDTTLIDFMRTFDRGFRLDYVKEPGLVDYIKSATHLVINWKNPKYKYCNETLLKEEYEKYQQNQTTYIQETNQPEYYKCDTYNVYKHKYGHKTEDLDEIDMKKAYSRFKDCPYYMGFPGIINQVRKVPETHDFVKYPGIYTVEIQKMPHHIIFPQLGIHTNHRYRLTSPILALLKKHGVQFTILAGAYSSSKEKFDFEFPQNMIDTKLYTIWPGMNLHFDTEEVWKMKCTKEFAGVVQAQSKYPTKYCDITETLLVTIPLEHHYTMPHIAAFIMSYTQATVIEEMLKYDLKNIYGTKLDSILIRGGLKSFPEVFQNAKEKDGFIGIRFSETYSTSIFKHEEVSYEFPDLPSRLPKPYTPMQFISGPGGSGKTHLVLGDKGNRNILYATRAWDLVVDKQREFSCFGSSINKLLGSGIAGEKIQSYKDEYGSPGVIVVDEMSMITTIDVEKIQEIYPYSLLILLGDYSIRHKMYYQSRISDGEQYKPDPSIILTLVEDYRSIDEPTKEFKKKVRNIMETTAFIPHKVKSFLVETLPNITRSTLKEKYDMDYVLTGSHAQRHILTELLKSTDDTKNHHYVYKHTPLDVYEKRKNPDNVLLHGEISKVPIENKTEIRHAFTVHSFQGRTIENKMCYIDIHNLHNAEDLYTAISRVRTLKNLVCVV